MECQLFFFTAHAGCSSSEADTDSHSDDTSISSPESDLAEEEHRVLGDEITPNSNIESLVDFGLNGDDLDWQEAAIHLFSK